MSEMKLIKTYLHRKGIISQFCINYTIRKKLKDTNITHL